MRAEQKSIRLFLYHEGSFLYRFYIIITFQAEICMKKYFLAGNISLSAEIFSVHQTNNLLSKFFETV